MIIISESAPEALFIDHFEGACHSGFSFLEARAQTGKWEYEGAAAELIILGFCYFQPSPALTDLASTK